MSKTRMQAAATERALRKRMTAQRNLVLTSRDLRKSRPAITSAISLDDIAGSVKIAHEASHILFVDTNDFSVHFLKNRSGSDLVTLRMNDDELHMILFKMGVEAGEKERAVNFVLGETKIKPQPLRRPPIWDLDD